MRKKSILILIPILMLTFFFQPTKLKADTTASIYVEPSVSNVDLFSVFRINISISQVTDLAAWDFELYYPSANLNATAFLEGPFLKQAGSTALLINQFTDQYNATHGVIWAACTLIGQGPGATGSGALAIITFKAKGGGPALLHINETDLLDSKMPPNHIPHTTSDGIVNVPEVDIAVTNLTRSRTIVGQHPTNYVNITATVQNKGALNATFELLIYVNTSLIFDKKNIFLQGGGNSKTISATWANPWAYAKGNYTLTAYVPPILGEVNIANNKLSEGWIFITIPGDVNGDRTVDVLDLIMVAKYLGRNPPDGYKPGTIQWYQCCNSDVYCDGSIDVLDLILVAQHLGQTW
jgi:hypothetical protein